MTLSSFAFLICLVFQAAPVPAPAQQAPKPSTPAQQAPRLDEAPPEKSSYLAFVDRDYIFTLEFVKPGVPLLNFVSMSESDHSLQAKDIRLTLDTRKVPGRFFVVDTGDPKQPITTPSLKMRARSSFGVRLTGDFGQENEITGATVTVGAEDLKLVPLTGFQFENLALKINRINLGSPDFTEDWSVLKMEVIGTRSRIRKIVTP
jgi:hypothetical protein